MSDLTPDVSEDVTPEAAPAQSSAVLPKDYRRGLEVAALALAVASVVLVFSGVGQAYATLHYAGSAQASFATDLKYLANVLASPLLALLVMIVSFLVILIRHEWTDERSRTRTVIAATAALVVALVVLVASVYDMVAVLTGSSTSLGASGAARFGQVTQDLFNIVLAVATLWIGTVLSANARKEEDAEAE